jgi:hypothetical protein
MTQLSSQTNLVFKIFLPLFLATLLGLLAVSSMFVDSPRFVGMSLGLARFLLPGIWFLWCVMWYKLLWPLLRIDADDAHVYVSNYSTTVRYPHAAIEKVTRKFVGPFEIVRIELIEAGRFGKSFPFIASRRRLSRFVDTQQDWQILYNRKVF